MNILPKKSWHVRNKDNVAKVRKDEEEARNQEKKRFQQIALAEQETRTNLLRKKARSSNDAESTSIVLKPDPSKPINFFHDIGPDGKPLTSFATNKEHEDEKRQEKEKEEMKLGLLTYLGQSAAESLPDEERPWYFKPPSRGEPTISGRDVVDAKRKRSLDPLADMEAHLKKKKKHKSSHKKHKSKKSSSLNDLSPDDKLAKLRKQRLEREAKEKQRSAQLLRKHYNVSTEDDKNSNSSFVPKYSNQFNPHFARNNKV